MIGMTASTGFSPCPPRSDRYHTTQWSCARAEQPTQSIIQCQRAAAQSTGRWILRIPPGYIDKSTQDSNLGSISKVWSDAVYLARRRLGQHVDRRSRRVASEVSEYSKAPLPVLIDQ